MADEPLRPGQGAFDPVPGWPGAPDPGPEGGTAALTGRPPSAPPPGWAGVTPAWAQPSAAPPPGPAAPGGPEPPTGPLRFLRSRRGMAIAGGVVALLLVGAAVGFVALGGDGDSSGGAGGPSRGRGGRSAAPGATGGREIPLLDGRLILVAPEGWEEREASADTATVKVELRLPGRDLVGTLVTAALPTGGNLDGLLGGADSTRFQVDTKGAGQLQGAVLPASGNVRAGALRPNATFFITLSVFALDGQPLDSAVLQKLFTEQVAPQLRIP